MAALGEKVVARIQNRRGNRINLPQPLEPGEIGWCLDSRQLFIGIDEANAFPAIEVYQGTGNQAAAQAVMDSKIIEFTTPYVRLDTDTSPVTNPVGTTSEVDVLNKLKSIPVGSFLASNTRTLINQLESSVGVLNDINNTLMSANAGNFPYIALYDWVERDNTTATVTVTLNAGSINSYTIPNSGIGYTSPPVITIATGDGINAALTAVVTDGTVSSIVVANAGTGYTFLTFTIAPPPAPGVGQSAKSYKFTYHVGFEQKDGGLEITDADMETYMTAISANTNILNPGELGDNATAPNTGKLKAFVGTSVVLPTTRQAGNIAGLINRIASATPAWETGLVNTKQNIEITTELSSSQSLNDVFIENPLTYELAASVGFIQIYNDGLSPYNSTPVEYSSTENDVQILEYSIFADEGGGATTVRTGKLRVATLDNGVDDTSIVDDDYIEHRGSLVTPVASAGPQFDFSASFNPGTNVITVKYRHDFAARVVLKFTTRRWYSF